MVMTPGAFGDGGAFPGVALGVERGGCPGGEQAAAGGDLHADDAHLLFDDERKELVGEGVDVRVGGVHGHEDAIEGVAIDGVDEGLGR